jgi:transposase-like protein
MSYSRFRWTASRVFGIIHFTYPFFSGTFKGMAGLLSPKYQNDEAAREHIEKFLWPEGPECPHCGLIGEAYKLQGETTRKGLYKCACCRKPFTATVGTIFENSKIPLHKWLLAVHLMCSSEKGISALQLQRNLGIGSYRSAWFMCHRIRWAMGQRTTSRFAQ